MSGIQLTVLLSIVGALASIVGIYYLARSNARENAREQAKKITDAVLAERERAEDAIRNAVAPLQLQLATSNQMIERRDRQLEAKDRRIEALEDELRRAR